MLTSPPFYVAACYWNVNVNDVMVAGAAGVAQLVILVLLVLMCVLV